MCTDDMKSTLSFKDHGRQIATVIDVITHKFQMAIDIMKLLNVYQIYELQ